MKIARRVKKITPSLTLEITSEVKAMKEQGEAVVNFAGGEPDFDTPRYIKEAAKRAIREGFTKYTPASGWPKLKQAIAKKLESDNHLHYKPAQIVVTSGAKQALYNTFQVLCEKGEEVICPSPYWVSYPEMVKLAEAKVRFLKTSAKNNFKINKDLLKRNITKKSKVLILNSPANPTGSVYSRRELQEIIEVVLRYNLYLVSDEIYEKFIFDGNKHTSCASLNKEIHKRTIVVNGVSKTYAMTGWRIGYLACADEKITKAIVNLQSHSTSGACSISQKAAWAAIAKARKSQIRKVVNKFQRRRDCMLRGLSEISALSFLKPEGAFYVFCNISKAGLDSVTFAQCLLKEAKVAVIAGRAFGKDDYVRLSFATSRNQIEEGTRRIKDWVEGQAGNFDF